MSFKTMLSICSPVRSVSKSSFISVILKRTLRTKSKTLEICTDRSVSYRAIPGRHELTVVYVPGLHDYSHMKGLMAQSLLRYCDTVGLSCVIYDHEGVGESHGSLAGIKFSHWIDDLLKVVEILTSGPIIIASLSVGCWISLIAARRLNRISADKVQGMVLNSPAINYVYPHYQRFLDSLSPEVRRGVESEGELHFSRNANPSYGNALIQKDFAEDSRRYEIDFGSVFELDCPVRILHGMADGEVHFSQSVKLVESLRTDDVELLISKNRGHVAERPVEVEAILTTLDRLAKERTIGV